MAYLDPLLFNGLRFAMGALVVAVLILVKGRRKRIPIPWKLGIILFIAASLQQIGIVYTTAGQAGLLTGLYVVIIPLSDF